MSVVNLTDVTKRYGEHVAVRDLSLTVPEGALYGFIGPNGSGKTSTIRMILRIIYPDVGEIEVFGKTSDSAANNVVGYLPEERGLYKKVTVRWMLMYYAALKGMTRSDARVAADEWLDKFGLSEWAGKKIESLSKGMSQKIQFIASVIARPKLLILDEPFSGLDPVNTEVIRSAILELRREGTTIIFSTHDMSVAEQLCDFVFMIYQGNKVLDGTLAEIKSTYGSDTIRLGWNGSSDDLRSIPGVDSFLDMGSYQEVQFQGDKQDFLRRVIDRGDVNLFEVAEPSLHDIFIRIAGADDTANDAAAAKMGVR